MFRVGHTVLWINPKQTGTWSGVVDRLGHYGGVDVAYITWDGIIVPPEYMCGKPMPVTDDPHVPVSELFYRVPNADDQKRKEARLLAIERYKAEQRARFDGVKPGTPVTWTVPATHWCAAAQQGTLEHFKGKLVKVFPESDAALVQEERWGQEMPAKLMDINIV